MVGSCLKSYGQGKKERSQEPVTAVGIYDGCKDPGHIGDGYSFSYMPRNNNLDIVCTEGHTYRPYGSKPRIHAHGQK